MKTIILVFTIFTLKTTLGNGELTRNEDLAEKLLECARQTMDGGLAAAGIPNFNPFEFQNFTINFGFKQTIGFRLALRNLRVEKLTNFELKSLENHDTDNSNRYYYDFSMIFPEILASGEFELNLKVLLLEYNIPGSISFNFNNFNFDGLWDMSVEDHDPNLDNFRLSGNVKSTKFEFHGAYPEIEGFANGIISEMLTQIINSSKDILWLPISWLGKYIFNEYYLKKDLVEAFLAQCQL